MHCKMDGSDLSDGEIVDDMDVAPNSTTEDMEEGPTSITTDTFVNGYDGCPIDSTPVVDDSHGSDEDCEFDDCYYDDEFDEEIDQMLEETLARHNAAESSKTAPDAPMTDDENRYAGLIPPHMVRPKIVMKHRGTEYFEVLPDGWIEVTHSSGLAIYLHRATRVCTMARPYFIGPGSVRNHDAPISAIPCYYQRQMKAQRGKMKSDEERANATQNGLNGKTIDEKSADESTPVRQPKVKVQTSDDIQLRNIKPKQIYDYCSSSFEFETINVMRFKSWSDRRAFRHRQREIRDLKLLKARSTMVNAKNRGTKSDPVIIDARTGRPALPAGVKLITVPDMETGSKPQQRQFFLNPQGKTSIAVLHEYVQKVMKGVVAYDFCETRNATNPYCAIVKISIDRHIADAAGNPTAATWTEYGKGEGNSKKSAKLNAAKQALRVLVPGIEFNEDGVADLSHEDDAGQLFDLIKITDSRVPELSAKAGQPTPFVILQECLKRNSAFGDTQIAMESTRIKHQQHEFFMKVGKHEVRVLCTNKKEGKQRAAQAMLEKLHMQIKTWGSLIRLYGYGAQRKLQETRKEKDNIIKLQVQSKQQANEPNTAILNKLRQEMVRLYEQALNGSDEVGNNDAGTSAVKNIDI